MPICTKYVYYNIEERIEIETAPDWKGFPPTNYIVSLP